MKLISRHLNHHYPLDVQVHTDMNLLRDVICSYEISGESHLDKVRGKFDEVGRCKIRPGTARQMGYRGILANLTLRRVNDAWALQYVWHCRRKLRTSRPDRLAHCYNGGPSLQWRGLGPARSYAAVVLALYRKATVAHIAAQNPMREARL